MPVLEIEKIYQEKAEIIEYRRASVVLEKWRITAGFLWDSDLATILKQDAIRGKKLEAVRKACGLLGDLTPAEWKEFTTAIRRRPLFDKRSTQ